jgi:hypothetical protein
VFLKSLVLLIRRLSGERRLKRVGVVNHGGKQNRGEVHAVMSRWLFAGGIGVFVVFPECAYKTAVFCP